MLCSTNSSMILESVQFLSLTSDFIQQIIFLMSFNSVFVVYRHAFNRDHSDMEISPSLFMRVVSSLSTVCYREKAIGKTTVMGWM